MSSPVALSGPVFVFRDAAERGASPQEWELGDLSVLQTGRVLELFDGTQWVQVGGAGAAGPQGPPGEAHFAAPTVSALRPGSPPQVAMAGSGSAADPYRLTLLVPEPEQGVKGAAGSDGGRAVFARPVVTMLPPMTPPTLEQTGSGTAVDPYVLHFGLPVVHPTTNAGATTMAGLTDVDVTGLAAGDLLAWNGTKWVRTSKADVGMYVFVADNDGGLPSGVLTRPDGTALMPNDICLIRDPATHALMSVARMTAGGWVVEATVPAAGGGGVGPVGPAGRRGSFWMVGAGPPAGTLTTPDGSAFAAGDQYLDATSGDVYRFT